MKRRVWQVLASTGAITTALSLAGIARAQEPAPAQDSAPAAAPAVQAQASGSAQAGGSAQGTGAMTLPGAAPAAQPNPGNSDHDQMVGHFAIGFLGTRSMLVGCAGDGIPGQAGCNPTVGGAGTVLDVAAPVIGARYWINSLIGIDAGIGVGIVSQSGKDGGGNKVNLPTTTAFLIHGGVPLALASSGHFAFEVIPEMNIGFGGWSEDVNGGPSSSGNGFHLDLGARAGAEIQFGFIGIPQLSLLGTVGLAFAIDNTSIKVGGTKAEYNTTRFGTSFNDSPWSIFTSNVGALYYF
jgi:hypothetical protein